MGVVSWCANAVMLNDEEGLRQLVQELDKSSKTDWLWKQL